MELVSECDILVDLGKKVGGKRFPIAGIKARKRSQHPCCLHTQLPMQCHTHLHSIMSHTLQLSNPTEIVSVYIEPYVVVASACDDDVVG